MASIFDVAKYILDGIGGEIPAMKLQKLCYYAQAWTLAWDDKPLFEEDFLKWEHGPVCYELFDLHRGLFTVDLDVISDDLLSTNPFSGDELLNIDQIVDEYGKFSGVQLSELTHSETPWKNTPKNEVITKSSMKEYYASRIA
jgi:uncharacterized phage-associated protein